jgi:hypothetical protein
VKKSRIRSLIRLLSAAMLAFVAVPIQPAAAAGLGLSGRLSVHRGGFGTSEVLSFNLSTNEPLGVFPAAPTPANGRSITFDRDGNVLVTWLAPDASFLGDGMIHKFARTGGPEIGTIAVPGGLNLGAIDFDLDENVIWGAVYRPFADKTLLVKINVSTNPATLALSCELDFHPGTDLAHPGAGNDTIAVGKIGGVKVVLTDAADGNLDGSSANPTTLFAINASNCLPVAEYPLKLSPADLTTVPRVTGVSLDPATGNLIVASIAANEASTDILNLGPAPFQGKIGETLTISGLVFDVAIDTTLLDDFNRADGTRFLGNLGPNWTGAVDGGLYRIFSNQLKAQSSGYIFWNATTFGPNQEAYITYKKVSTVATDQDLLLKVQNMGSDGVTGGPGFSLIEVQYDATMLQPGTTTKGMVLVNTHVPYTPTRPSWVTHFQAPLILQDGDQLGAKTTSTGDVVIYKNGSQVYTTTVAAGTTRFPANLTSGGGKVGLWVINATSTNFSLMDNFRGGNTP